MSYAIRDVFLTLQGEGARAGTKAVFVRFAGCNLWTGRPEDRQAGKGACARWCDTDFFKGEKLSAEELEVRMSSLWPPGRQVRWCVLTGGEPLLQVDSDLVTTLISAGWFIAVETNGTVEPEPRVRDGLSWITVSPKIGGTLKLQGADEVKVVLPGGDPGWDESKLEVLGQLAGARFVQPQDPILPEMIDASYLAGRAPDQAKTYQRNLERCQRFVMGHPDWRVSLQTHKLMGVP